MSRGAAGLVMGPRAGVGWLVPCGSLLPRAQGAMVVGAEGEVHGEATSELHSGSLAEHIGEGLCRRPRGALLRFGGEAEDRVAFFVGVRAGETERVKAGHAGFVIGE